jgi:hypothetical protein
MVPLIELMLFENCSNSARTAIECGVDQFLIDWECLGKEERQDGFDTEIRPGTAADLRAIAALPKARAWCRINGFGPNTAEEIETAAAAGASGIFLPMVRSPREVEMFLQRVAGRCATGIFVETVEAFATALDLAALPLERVYFGLNDFAISRGSTSIFLAMLDGSVERMRDIFAKKDFGFGGITAVDAGYPVPSKRLIEEMARLDCQFSFLRRSFRRDTMHREPKDVVAGIHRYWQHCRERDPATIRLDRIKLEACLRHVCG